MKYIEGDYYVVPEKEKEYLEKYKARDEEGQGQYHINFPFSLETQKQLFSFAGFSRVELVWEEGENEVFVAEKKFSLWQIFHTIITRIIESN